MDFFSYKFTAKEILKKVKLRLRQGIIAAGVAGMAFNDPFKG